ncbi:MAG TPA: hypothetical protein DHV96_12690 [Lachnospiraceae bacterium]|nr:hypothetical protein [Lachnospiraceae bacterium]
MMKVKKYFGVFLLFAALIVCMRGIQSQATTSARGVNGLCNMSGNLNPQPFNQRIFTCTLYNNTSSEKFAEAYLRVYKPNSNTIDHINSSANVTHANGGSRSPSAARVANTQGASMSGLLRGGRTSTSGEIDHVNLTAITQ